jgi:flagellar basal-body rod protein FlgB
MSSWINDSTMQNLERALGLRLKRQELIASNIANVDTPGYQPVDLAFEGALSHAMKDGDTTGAGMNQTDGSHVTGEARRDSESSEVVERPDVHNSIDGNGVDLDRELTRFADNKVRFEATAESTRRRFLILNYVIQHMSQS